MTGRASDQVIEVRLCGRPTRSGKPCRMRLYGPETACRTHLTEHERDVAEAYQRGMGAGHRRGWENGQEIGKQQVERLERRIRELEGLLGRGPLPRGPLSREPLSREPLSRDPLRNEPLPNEPAAGQVDGQVVEVDGYAYRWPGRPLLRVGDRVVLPENWLSRRRNGPGAFEGTVTRLGSTFDGELPSIVRRLCDGPGARGGGRAPGGGA